MLYRCALGVFGFFVVLLTQSQTSYAILIGAGISDITDAAYGQVMMGYARTEQKTKGIHIRLWSRAFVVEMDERTRVALVTVDLAMLPQFLRSDVIDQLNLLLPGKFHDDNVLIQATHTHAGAGGYSHFPLYQAASLGFRPKNYQAIVQGITESIFNADHSRVEGCIKISEGNLFNASKNRSLAAYEADPEAVVRESSTNPKMTLLKFERLDGGSLGILNWFAVHATALSNRNRYISGDNKGLAAYRFEVDQQMDYEHRAGFVAGFANSEEGDSSPHVDTIPDEELDFQTLDHSAQKQYDFAQGLFYRADETLEPKLRYWFKWQEMSKVSVGNRSMCDPALGYSFAAGAEDGPSEIDGIYEGMTVQSHAELPFLLSAALSLIKGELLPVTQNSDRTCQWPKPIFSVMGRSRDLVWTPMILPFQVIQIGDLAIIGIPVEATTVSGARIKAHVLKLLEAYGVKRAVIAGLANDYSGYLATFEEYQQQHYEGASTLYGPHTLEGYLKTFEEMVSDPTGASSSMVRPRVLTHLILPEQKTGGFDNRGSGEKFGQVLRQPNFNYSRGPIIAVFRSAHPDRVPLYRYSTLEIQKKNQTTGIWEVVRRDWDEDTRISWSTDSIFQCWNCNRAQIEWWPKSTTPSGEYRVLHRGYSKGFLSSKTVLFEGVSRSFLLNFE